MASKIEWCDETWNPVTGCEPIGEACRNCYAERMVKRFPDRFGGVGHPFRVTYHPARFTQPLHWRKPRRVFVCSMGDLFHRDVSRSWIDQVLAIACRCQRHTFMILTKRPERMGRYFRELATPGGAKRFEDQYNNPMALHKFAMMLRRGEPLPNVWLGTSVWDQESAGKNIPELLKCPASIRFVSAEPLLAPLDLSDWPECCRPDDSVCPFPCDPCDSEHPCNWRGLDWVICGGESGAGARPVHQDWVRSLRGQCVDTGTPFMFKQWGDYLPSEQDEKYGQHDGCRVTARPAGTGAPCCPGLWTRLGKAKAGRMLDGEEWLQFPEAT